MPSSLLSCRIGGIVAVNVVVQSSCLENEFVQIIRKGIISRVRHGGLAKLFSAQKNVLGKHTLPTSYEVRYLTA